MSRPISPVNVSTIHRKETFSPGGNENAQYNLKILFNRLESGILYRVNREGRLETINSFWGRFCYYLNRTAEQKAVKRVITEALNNYSDYLSRIEDEAVDRFAAKQLFQRIGGLSPAVLDRSHFYSHNKLSEYTILPQTLRVRVGDAYLDCVDREMSEGDPYFLTLDLGNDRDTADFGSLLAREEGEFLRAELDGPLETVESKTCYRFEQKRQEKRIRGIITRVLDQLSTTLKHMEITRSHKVALKKIFTNSPLSRMSRKVYKRGGVAEGSYLEGVLSDIFRLELVEKREALKTALKTFHTNGADARAVVEAKFMDWALEEYNLTYQLGLDLERVGDGGSGGARYARDRFGRKILVVKPGDEGPHGPNNPQWYAKVKQWFISPRSCLRGNSEPLAEVDSYLLDRRLGIYQVPPTEWRYIASRQFNGNHFKECSVQMFVEGCKTLGEYVNVSPIMHNLPRPLLRWYCGEEGGKFPRAQARECLLDKVPKRSAERIAAHNLGIEDIDCHFENILVMVRDADHEPNLIERIFGGEQVTDEEIDAFVDTLSSRRNNQAMLQAILFSEPATVDKEEKLVTLVKHDGGSSNPHHHPEGFFSTRFKHLFEVLPSYEQPFTEEFREFLTGKELSYIRFLLEKSVRGLRNTLDGKAFRDYWNNPRNRGFFKLWILETHSSVEKDLRGLICSNLLQSCASTILAEKGIDIFSSRETTESYIAYLKSHLERIHWNIETRLDSWRLLKKIADNRQPIRRGLQTCTEEDFTRELAGRQPDALDVELAAAKQRGVNNEPSYLEGKYYVGMQVLADLGEGDGVG